MCSLSFCPSRGLEDRRQSKRGHLISVCSLTTSSSELRPSRFWQAPRTHAAKLIDFTLLYLSTPQRATHSLSSSRSRVVAASVFFACPAESWSSDCDLKKAARQKRLAAREQALTVPPADSEPESEASSEEKFQAAYAQIHALMKEKGLSLIDIVTELHKYVPLFETNPKAPMAKAQLIASLADAEQRLAVGTNEKLQLGGLVGLFYQARTAMAAH